MAIILAVATLICVPAALVGTWQFVEERRRKAISWRRIDKLIVDLVHEIENENFNPDLIIGVGRGGSLVAAIIATNLEGRIEMACVDTHVKEDPLGRKHVVLRRPGKLPNVRDRHVLVVVAELYSGQDMRDALNYLQKQEPANLRSLAVLVGPSSNVRPSFIGVPTKHQPLAPWRLTDAARKGRI